MTTTRRTIVLGTIGWVGVHLALALLALDKSRLPSLSLVAMLLGCALIGLVVRPLITPGHPPTSDSSAVESATEASAGQAVNPWLVAAAVPALQLLAVLPLQPGALLGYANWPGNALGVVLASLLVRRQTALAVATGLAQASVLWLVYAAAPGPDGIQLSSALLLMAPIMLWLGVGWGVRRELSRSGRIVAMYLDRAASDQATATVHDLRQVASKDWFAQLSDDVLPLLDDVVAADDPSTEELRTRADLLARSVRDSLRARALLSPEVTAAIRASRGRGVVVRLHSEVPADSADAARVAGIGPLVVALLGHPSLESLVVHVSEDPLELIATVKLPPRDDRAITSLLTVPGWTCTTARLDDELIVRGQPS